METDAKLEGLKVAMEQGLQFLKRAREEVWAAHRRFDSRKKELEEAQIMLFRYLMPLSGCWQLSVVDYDVESGYLNVSLTLHEDRASDLLASFEQAVADDDDRIDVMRGVWLWYEPDKHRFELTIGTKDSLQELITDWGVRIVGDGLRLLQDLADICGGDGK
jgi:hypothetical protein